MDTSKYQALILELKGNSGTGEPSGEFEFDLDFPDPAAIFEEMTKADADPQFVLYTTVQMQMLSLAAMLEKSGSVDEYQTAVESARATYMPGFPPMSPVTDSYFFLWSLLDLKFGENQDNIGRIAVELMTEIGSPTELLGVCDKLLSSRMGIYETVDVDDDLLVVGELVTGRELLVDAPSGYFGAEGMLRFVRLGPPELHDAEYWTELTTPYILQGHSADDWTRYLHSVMPQSVGLDGTASTRVEDRLAAVFQEDCGALPWLEFIFQGYHSYRGETVFLTGIPDDPASLPHAEESDADSSSMNDVANIAQSLGALFGLTGSGELTEIEVTLAQAQRQTAAELMHGRRDVFKPETKGQQRIQLHAIDWGLLSKLTEMEFSKEAGTGRTRLRNLHSAVVTALGKVESQPPELDVTTTTDAATQTIYRMRVDLVGISPPIWRRIEVPDCLLSELHGIVQAAMGWHDEHLHEFTINGKRYSITSPDGSDVVKSTRVWLRDVVHSKGAKLNYLYDFGDGWEHEIKVEAIETAIPSATYPHCITGKRNCPPEDCGGVSGYVELLDVLSDPDHPENAERIDWYGRLDSEEFDASDRTTEMQDCYADLEQLRDSLSRDFDINADLFDDDGEHDREEFEDWCNYLDYKFTNSPEWDSLPVGEYGYVEYFLHHAIVYVGVVPTTMSIAELEEVLYSIFPSKVSVGAEEAESIVLELNAFFRFIHREYSVTDAEKLASVLNEKAAARMAVELGNESNFGLANSFLAKGQASDFDMTSQDGLDQFASAINSNLTVPDSGSGNLSFPTAATLPIKREGTRLGRNDPCHCGSGKKYKKCCLRNDG